MASGSSTGLTELRVGTAGWDYPGWKGAFYPEDLPARERLVYYARHFSLVEINVSFYRFVRPSTYEKWRQKVPASFLFTAKIHRLFTHLRRLKIDDEVLTEWQRWRAAVQVLGDQLGGLLLQLPPSLKADLTLLHNWIEATRPHPAPLFVEARHPSWLTEEVWQALRTWQVGWVFSHSSRWPSKIVCTTETAYLRFHGPREMFYSRYEPEELAPFVDELCRQRPARAFVIFNNTYRTNALDNARDFERLWTERCP